MAGTGFPERIVRWVFVERGKPLERRETPPPPLKGGEVLVEVAGCGVCHTDLGFYYQGVPTRRGLPITLGHEVSGRVVAAGDDTLESLVGRSVIVPAVMPCGECDLCRDGFGSICPRQVFPGSDIDGGFASHLVVPGRDLCLVETQQEGEGETIGASGVGLAELSVIADAVTTPYQSIVRSGLREGDLAIFVGVGGVGSFGVQLAAALGAYVVALDVSPLKLDRIAHFGARFTIDVRDLDHRSVKKRIIAHAKAEGLPTTRWKIFETSGTTAGQELAFSLLGPGAYLGVVGYTRSDVCIPLSRLMAFDATARGNWGCHPRHYPEVLSLVLAGKVKIAPFVESHPMSEINEVFPKLHEQLITKRPVLIPDFA